MPNSSKIKLITFDAYNTLFKPKGSLSAQYVKRKMSRKSSAKGLFYVTFVG